MYLSKADIADLDKVKRLNIINSISGIKPANLVGTQSKNGQTNLAIISSVIHIGSKPPYLGLILRPTGEVPRHTYENIKETGVYTINHVHESFIEQAHYTSAKFDRSESEFDHCSLNVERIKDFEAPFVRESQLKIGMSFAEEISIPLNGTILMIGSVEHIIIPDNTINAEGLINLSASDTVGISGLNSYYALSKLATFPYARKEELPDFS